jgi:hypothetical protein
MLGEGQQPSIQADLAGQAVVVHHQDTFCDRASCAKGLLNTGGVLASVRDPRQWRAATLT